MTHEHKKRIYKVITDLREIGFSFEEIMDFWRECIKEAKRIDAETH
tara:strand:- start:22 stop:159 length:138 start_codon:yes stop_codon:yes gene_type:complete